MIPTGSFFLEILRYRLSIANKWGPLQLMKCEKEDLDLWLLLLIQATHQIIGIHNITSSILLIFFISYASKRGIGWFNSEGIEWIFKLPLSMQGILYLNLLKCIAAKTTIYITLKVLQVYKMEDVIKMH